MRAMEDATFMRKAMKAGPVNWGELAGAISDFNGKAHTAYLGKSSSSYPARCV